MNRSTSSRIARKIWEEANGKIPDGYEIDHIDQDYFNNSLDNLRICTHAENTRNRKKWPNTTSKYKGVYLCKRRLKWISQITIDGKTKYIGQFNDQEDAHLAWLKIATKIYGEFIST